MTFFKNLANFGGGVRPLDMAHVEQLRDDGRWYVQLSAIWHWYLPFSIYINFFNFVFIHSFFILFFNLVSIN